MALFISQANIIKEQIEQAECRYAECHGATESADEKISKIGRREWNIFIYEVEIGSKFSFRSNVNLSQSA